MKPFVKKAVIIAVVIFVILTGGKMILEKNLKELAETKIENVDLTTVKDGTYTGSYEAMPVSANVTVTVLNNKITNIKINEHNNGQGSSAETIITKVLEAQKLDVDTVAGATYSSKVILKAIENALTVKK